MTSGNTHADDYQRFADWGRDHGQAVRGYLLAMVRRTNLADDLTQEVFSRAWQARRRYREQGSPRSYLLRIADRLVIDRSRKAGREVNLDEDTWRQIEPAGRTAEPIDNLVQAEAIGQLTAALDRLSPAQRRVLLLRYYGQLSFAEIAEVVGCPISTALSHSRRGLQTLRKTLVEDAP
ncbi:MAG: RNA polymerase sigma factor [Pirellulales bacterium]|nr:RNA polymerase sigma factor [Pirellulales bacterium]